MRILQLTKKFPFPRKDGEAWAVLALAEGLMKAGAVVDLFSITSDSSQSEEEAIKGITRLEIYDRVHLIEVDIAPKKIRALLNIFSTKSYHKERYEIQQVSDELTMFVRDQKYDVIIAETLYMMPFALETQDSSKVILRAHNIEHLIWSRYAARKGFLKSQYFNLQSERLKTHELEMMRRADGILPISSHDDEMIKGELGITIPSLVTPIGMKTELPFKNENEGLPLMIGFIGSLDWRPNLEGVRWFITEVWPLIFNSDRETRFMVAGRSGADVEHLKSVDGVAFVGEVPDSDQFVRALDIMVAPILSGSGTRVKILQSLSIGVPVVGTTIAMEGLDLNHEQEIMIADDPTQWRDAIDALSDNPKLWYKISNGGQEYLRNNHDTLLIGEHVKRFISAS